MRKLLILLFLAAVIAFSISGCGGGSSADPLGTDSITFTGAASQVNSNGTAILTATVKNASGDAVAGREVSFGFASNASGATLSRAEASTDSVGEVTITYNAGSTGGNDIVRASINSGKSADVYITVGSGGTFTGYQIAFAQGEKLVSTGIYSILIATVTGLDASGNLAVIPNESVKFSILTGTGILTDLSDSTITGPTVTVNTGADGVAKVIFTAPTKPGSTIFDARIPTGINKQLTISW